MKRNFVNRRTVILVATGAFVAGCQVVPKTAPTQAPVAEPPAPRAETLPTDQTRHRVALLVPMSGANGAVGQSIANATTMALLDTNASNLRITTYDTAAGATAAAARAIADGNMLVLGPLLRENVGTVQAAAQRAGVPVISFSNDASVAGGGVFVMGHLPEQSIARSVAYAKDRGANVFSAVIPDGEYGERAAQAFAASVRREGGRIGTTQRYARGNTSVVSAAQRLTAEGRSDAVLLPDGARLAARAAETLKQDGSPILIGTELWSGEGSITRSPALRGAIFSAVSDDNFKQFSDSYKARFGNAPYRISTLGYDGVLLALNVAENWRVGRPFPARALVADSGFLGLDGAFRFLNSGVIQRAMEVRRVEDGRISVVEPAPTKFD